MNIKRFTTFLLSLIFCVLSVCTFGCTTNTTKSDNLDDSAFIIEKAIVEIDNFNETLFSAVQKPTSETPALYSAGALLTNVEADYGIRGRTIGETISRQMNIKYVYEIVNYVLQMSRKNKDYNNKFKINETYYGSARKTISEPLNALFEDPNVPDPVLTIQVKRDKYSLNFAADWDWRNEYLEQNLPAYNVVICTNGRIEYDQNKKDIKSIRMNWFWEYANSELMSSYFDFENDEFYFMSTHNAGEYHSEVEESIANFYNNGTLTPQTIIEQKCKDSWAVKSNITTNASNLVYRVYQYYDDNTSIEGTVYPECENDKPLFDDLFAEVYNKVKVLPIRTKNDFITLDANSTLIDYMNDAAIYGINRSRVVANDNGASYLFLNELDMKNIFNQLANDSMIKVNDEASEFISNAKQSYNAVENRFVGELGTYDSVKYTLSYEHDGYTWDNWIIFCDNFKYKIANETEKISFNYNNGTVSNVVYTHN